MTHYVHTHPTAAKAHVCDLCRRVIRPGEPYLRGSGMDGCTAWTWRECAHCQTIRDLAQDGEYDLGLLAEWEPMSVAQMRARVLWLRRWTRPDGTLYPVPAKVMREDEHGFSWQVDVRHPDGA